MSVVERHYFMRWRGVDVACQLCGGVGVRQYGNGSGWRGGAGTASYCWDLCDRCWGSGDEHRHFDDQRLLAAQRKQWDEAQVFEYLARKLGVGLGDVKDRIRDLAHYCKQQSNRRKLPQGQDHFWWAQTWDMLGVILRKLADGQP